MCFYFIFCYFSAIKLSRSTVGLCNIYQCYRTTILLMVAVQIYCVRSYDPQMGTYGVLSLRGLGASVRICELVAKCSDTIRLL